MEVHQPKKDARNGQRSVGAVMANLLFLNKIGWDENQNGN